MPFQLRLDRRPSNKMKTWDQLLPKLGLVVEAGPWRLSYKGVSMVETYKRWQRQGLDINQIRQVIRDQMAEFKLDRSGSKAKVAKAKNPVKAKASSTKRKTADRSQKKTRPRLKIIRR